MAQDLTVTILFYVFAALSVISAFLVITSRHPVRAVVALVFTFIFAACTWLLLEVEYLALLLIVVYIGAVMVLFMFVIMMLDINVEFNRAGFVKHWPVAFVVTILVIALLVSVVGPSHFGLGVVAAPKPLPADYSSIKALGTALFSGYLYPFILSAVILLAAMIAGITLTFRGRRPGVRAQVPAEQIRVQPKDRLKVVKMKSEAKKS